MPFRCDFHVHSDISDGTLGPAELVERAQQSGIDCLALTDHDEVAGVGRARERGAELGLEVLGGVELSVSEAEGKQRIHILGLGIDAEELTLVTRLERTRQARIERGAEIVECLHGLGVPLSSELVREVAGHGSLGRPHIARALVRAGFCASSDEAFDRFLRSGQAAYVPAPSLGAREAIDLVHGAGGIAVLAHPRRVARAGIPGGLDGFLAKLRGLGLDGLEIYHPSHRPRHLKRLRRLARSHALVPTGGSDFHGEEHTYSKLGDAAGSDSLDRALYDGVLSRIADRRP